MSIIRQRIIQYAKEHPEILRVPADANNGLLIVTGLPRTGSTFLQALLALDPNAKTPLTWEMWRTVPPDDGSDPENHPNVKAMKKDVQQVDFACPRYMNELRRVHYFDATSPEEDVIFLYHAPWRWNFLLFFWNTAIADWMLDNPLSGAFSCRYLHLCFKVMISKIKPRHIITKNPGHSYYLEELLREFPNANIVVTHRTPNSVVPSWSTICLYSWHLFYQNEFDNFDKYDVLSISGHTKAMMKQLSVLAQRLTDSRKKFREQDPEKESKQFFDIKFSELIDDPVQVVQNIYNHFGYEFTEEFRRRILEYEENQPRLQYPRVPYSLEELGLTKEIINSEFRDYIDTYKEYF